MYHHDEGCANDASDRRNVANEIEIELVVERRVGRVVAPDHEQRVAVCGRAHDRLGADVGAATGPVVDYELLAKPLRQPLSHQSGRARISVSPAGATGTITRTGRVG